MSSTFGKKLAALKWSRQGEDSDSDEDLCRPRNERTKSLPNERTKNDFALAPLTDFLGPESGNSNDLGLGYLMDRRPSIQLVSGDVEHIRGMEETIRLSPDSNGGKPTNYGLSLAPLAISPDQTPDQSREESPNSPLAYPPTKNDFREVSFKSLNLKNIRDRTGGPSGSGEICFDANGVPLSNPNKRLRTPKSARSPFLAAAKSFGFPAKALKRRIRMTPIFGRPGARPVFRPNGVTRRSRRKDLRQLMKGSDSPSPNQIHPRPEANVAQGCLDRGTEHHVVDRSSQSVPGAKGIPARQAHSRRSSLEDAATSMRPIMLSAALHGESHRGRKTVKGSRTSGDLILLALGGLQCRRYGRSNPNPRIPCSLMDSLTKLDIFANAFVSLPNKLSAIQHIGLTLGRSY